MLCAALACGLATSALAAVAPVSLKYLVEALAGAGGATLKSDAFLVAGGWLGAYVGALLAVRIAGEIRSLLFGFAEQAISRRMSRRAVSHVMALPMKVHADWSTGGVVQTLENGLHGYRLILQHGLMTLVPGVIEIVLVAALLLHFFDSVFLLVYGVCAAAYILVFHEGARRTLRASRDVSSARIAANARLTDSLLNLETVKAYCGEDVSARRYDARLAETQARWQRFYCVRLLNGLLVALVFTAGLAGILWLASERVQDGAMSVGDIVLVNAWMLQVVRPLELLGYAIRDIGQGAAFVERLNGLLQETPEEQDLRCARVLPQSGKPPKIRFENVSFSYGQERKVLDNVSFEIEAGQVTALVGPSGSGKSSVIRLLMRFWEPDEGRIFIDGADIAHFPPAQVRRMIALVAQDNAVFNESLGFNIAFPEESADPSRVRWAAEQVLLGDLIARLPEGYAAMAGERGLKLSGGEKQRLALARAVMRRGQILLADEATSAVDNVTEARLSARGVFSKQGVTTVLVAHRLASIAHANDIIVMDAGRVVERGSHSDLRAAGGLYAQMWGAQM